MEFLVKNWQSAFDQTFALFEQIKDSGFVPEVIVGIARGGWIPARLLSDFFSLKFTANIKVEAYHLIGEMDVEAKITQDLNAPIENKRILLVDDIADTGSSLGVVIKRLRERSVKDLRVATLFYKQKSTIVPDFFVEKTNVWVVFPWEIFETCSELSEIWKSENMTNDEIKHKLKTIGLPPTVVNSFFED